MILIQKGFYRLGTITNILKEVDPITSMKDGLAIEKKINDNSYYVVAFIRYNEEREQVEFEDVDFRILDIDKEDWNIVKDLIVSAKDIVLTQNLDKYKGEN